MSCEIKFAHAHVRARTHMCDVHAKRLLKHACDVRACGRPGVRRAIAIFARFWVKKGPILDFILPGKYKKNAKFASKLPLCYKRACACAIRILAKRTRACGRKSSVRMCVRARQKIVATHRLSILNLHMILTLRLPFIFILV